MKKKKKEETNKETTLLIITDLLSDQKSSPNILVLYQLSVSISLH